MENYLEKKERLEAQDWKPKSKIGGSVFFTKKNVVGITVELLFDGTHKLHCAAPKEYLEKHSPKI